MCVFKCVKVAERQEEREEEEREGGEIRVAPKIETDFQINTLSNC